MNTAHRAAASDAMPGPSGRLSEAGSLRSQTPLPFPRSSFRASALAGLLGLLLAGAAFGKPAEEPGVALARQGQSAWSVAAVSPKDKTVCWAASELQKYLRQMTGAAWAEAKPSSRRPQVWIGLRNDFPAEARKLLPPAKEGHDGYAVLVREKPARILIAGDNRRGCVYGVYDLLERLGCRWFYPTEDPKDPEVVPQRPTLTLPAGGWAVASPLKYRISNGSAWYFKMDYAFAGRQLDWAMKTRHNLIGWQSENTEPLAAQYRRLGDKGLLAELEKRDMSLHGPAHSFNHFLSDAEHFEAHPEWFGMRDGKRCRQTASGAQFCWSHAGARQEFVKNVAAFARESPLISILCIVAFDGGRACDCPECRKLGASNALMTLLREVIEAVETCRPDMLVETVSGYEPMTVPPKGVAIHPRQRTAWAHWGRYHGSGYDDPRYDRKDNLEQWRQASPGGLTLVQYYTDNFAEPWVMGPFAAAMESDRRYILSNRIDSIYNLMWPVGFWWNHGLNAYLSGRCFYDVSLSPFDEIPDYALNYFGPAAGPLLGRYHLEWARNIELSYRAKDASRKEDRARLAAQRKQYIDPAVAAVRHDPLLAYRVGKVAQLHTLAERMTEVHRQRDNIQILRKQGKFDEAARLLEAARADTDEVMAMFHRLADSKQGLIEKQEIPSYIQAKIKNWVDEEARDIAAKNSKVEPGFWRQLNELDMLPAEILR